MIMMASMTTTLTLDKAGRVVLPKPVRDELQLAAGDSLVLESSEEGIMLRPLRGAAGLRKKQGVWVLANWATSFCCRGGSDPCANPP